jgi:F0F1-type ATP synthase membrane subunit a
MGEQGSQFTPTIGWVFILAMIISLLGLGRGFISPITSIWITAGFALAAFLLVQYHDVKLYGVKNYAAKRIGGAWWLVPIKLPFAAIRELVRPVLLALRLSAGILGEDVVAICLVLITIEVVWNTLMPYHFPMVLCEFFTSFILAIVFSTFVAVYISVVRSQRVSQPVG